MGYLVLRRTKTYTLRARFGCRFSFSSRPGLDTAEAAGNARAAHLQNETALTPESNRDGFTFQAVRL